jgi:hypothetical protein
MRNIFWDLLYLIFLFCFNSFQYLLHCFASSVFFRCGSVVHFYFMITERLPPRSTIIVVEERIKKGNQRPQLTVGIYLPASNFAILRTCRLATQLPAKAIHRSTVHKPTAKPTSLNREARQPRRTLLTKAFPNQRAQGHCKSTTPYPGAAESASIRKAKSTSSETGGSPSHCKMCPLHPRP